jgi:uncharacterized protein (TIGR00369 family)
MGFRYLRATADEVVAELPVAGRHLNPDGTVDHAVYCGMIEAAASAGAALMALRWGQLVVGTENQTTFFHHARSGRIRVTAAPLLRGRKTQVWEAHVTDAGDRLLASGKLRLLNIAADGPLVEHDVDRLPCRRTGGSRA